MKTKIDHLFRQEYAKLISYLTAKFGVQNIDNIEDSVQDALYKAMQLWAYQDFPKEPSKWLYKVAHNALIDRLRRDQKLTEYEVDKFQNINISEDEAFAYADLEIGINDEQLKMILACCHPKMKVQEQIMLSLKLLCGFSNIEIAKSLFKKPETVKKAITRAKQKFKTEVGNLELPDKSELNERLEVVLKVIYLLFNKGYASYIGDSVLKKDVCEEAIRLASLLYNNERSNSPSICALLALMCFKFSRFEARVDESGNLLTMVNQDWEKWDREMINWGRFFMEKSAEGSLISKYHLEAGIAYEYAFASSFSTIDWSAILNAYDVLVSRYYSPAIALNRLVVLEKVKGPKMALKNLIGLNEFELTKNHLYYSIKADFEKKLNIKNYKESLKQAILLTTNQKEKAFLKALL